MKFFEGCTALITGASAGLGAEFARQLAPHAKSLVLVARRNHRLEALRDELTALHGDLSVHIYAVDVAQEEPTQGLVQWLEREHIAVNFLINNAGLGDRGSFATSDWNRIRPMLDVNIKAMTHLTHLLLPRLQAAGRAAILNVSSLASFLPLPNSAVYAATKAYVTSLSEALRIELKGSGISVTALCPGPVETEFFTVAGRDGPTDYSAYNEAGPAFVLTAEEVVRAGLEAVANNKPRVIPGLIVGLAMLGVALTPMFILRKILERRFAKGE